MAGLRPFRQIPQNIREWTRWMKAQDIPDAGADGKSTHFASVYQRAASAPDTPLDNSGSYNFTTKVLTAPPGWSANIPSGTDPVYVSNATFEVIGTTGIDVEASWSTPVIVAQDGATGSTGAAGGDASTVSLAATSYTFSYDNATGSQVLIGPSSITFTLNRQNITGSTAWAAEDSIAGDQTSKLTSTTDTSATLTEANFDTITNNSYVKVTATADGISDTITIVELLSGQQGDTTHFASVFLRKASSPTEPVTDDGSYNFTTQTLTAPSISGGSADDWSVTVPAGSDPLYVSNGIFEINGLTGTDSTVDWTAPAVLASDGAAGSAGGDGDSVFVGNVFLRKASAPTEPVTDDGSYNFTTNTLTPPSTGGGSADDWSITVPSGTDPLYVSSGSFEISGATGTDSTVDWTAPVILASDGVAAVAHYLTNEAHVVAADNDGTNYSFTGAGGTHKLFDGITDKTTTAVHSVSGSATKNGLTMAVVSGTGVYSLSGASWTSDEETFTLRAAYSSTNYDKLYTIAKAKAGADAVAFVITVSGETIEDSRNPSEAIAGVRVNNDGTMDKRLGSTYSQIDTATDWIKPNSHPGQTYHARLTVTSGSGPDSGSDATNTWININTSPEWLQRNSSGGNDSGAWLLEISGDGGITVLDSATYSMTADNTP